MINLLERRTDFACGSLNKAGMAELAEIFSHEFSAMGLDIDPLPGRRIDMPSCPPVITVLIWVANFLLANKAMANDCCFWFIWKPFFLPTVRSKAIAEEVTG